ncbi:hypothetical protein SH591_03880 [Sphingomonas sp. LY54]|uniref:hypothetical protein n=1 Tax=Sphingomonadales TaxID=204457 RepID=UPI002ADEFBA6|nr:MULTISPECIES: hypothetical protein [Sphingomonadales]MEA1014622.1 hypothetical protein [Sphingosinicella sp. LY1275]WRP29333.1 hypothetical protein SH591_03880 [Sphingomonas sp. LY54]
MQPLLQPSLADSLGGIWSALHKDVELTISESQVHYLRTMALMIDDDVTSSLLLRKLRVARIVAASKLPRDTVAMNSFLEYLFDGGQKQFCQLLHPSIHRPDYALPITGSVGAGLIGLRAGQTILWPDESGTLCDLTAVHVENCPGLSAWLGRDPA